MEKLNDDCMLNIFQYLPIIDRLRAEAVSRRWHSLIKRSWSSFKCFALQDLQVRKFENRYDVRRYVINEKAFKNLLKRCGRYLISIDLSSQSSFYPHPLTPKCIEYITKFCPNLQALNLGQLRRIYVEFYRQNTNEHCEYGPREPRDKVIQTLLNWEKISNLKKFQVKDGLDKLHKLTTLISKMKNLESLHIAFDDSRILFNINIAGFPFSTLNEIIFEDCRAPEEEDLIEIVKSVRNLRTLVLYELRSYWVLHELLPSQCESLENLLVCEFPKNIYLDGDIKIAQSFVNIKKLNLRLNESLVTDEFLQIMTHHCKELVFLDISENREITDSGIQHVVSLPKLQCLFMDSLDEITGKTLIKMDNLEFLSCMSCKNLEDEGLCAIVKQSKLRGLDIESCHKITNKFLDAVNQEMNSRGEKRALCLIVKLTQINLKNQENISPLLHFVLYKEEFLNLYVPFPETRLFGFS